MDLDHYKELSTLALEDLSECPCDIFLSLPSGKKLVIGKLGNLINYDLIKKYDGHCDVKVIVHIDDYPVIVQKRIERKVSIMKERLKKEQWVNRLSRFDNELNSMAMVRVMASNFGIDEQTLTLVEATMESTLYTMEKIPSLKTIIADVCGRGDFFLQKALMINYLAIFALKNGPWYNEDTRSKLSMAAFLHDFRTSEVAFIQEGIEDDVGEQVRRRYDEFKNHPEYEFTILSQVQAIPHDVAQIVRFHHVGLDGKGFPESMSGQLSPLSQIFNIAHNLCVELIKNGHGKKVYSGYYYDLSNRILEKYKDSLVPFSLIL